ncbi:DUF3376 domain-containing protein [Streptomyces sp. NPDC004647]|uniref:DUF3376 domain-containing protein n=1 Tax=Streptomyces sp. NPDC004647 TaxID=3154671 RepID=UPI0033B712AC
MTDVDDDARNHETRLALVLNGGVSLAVWMGGVTHELDLLRRASSGNVENAVPDEADLPVFKIWARLARKAGTRVSIDIVSGTSAGGLNGLLLATALARGSALPNLRQVWEESAALDKLIKPLSKTSVLSGESFEQKINDALGRIDECAGCTQQSVTLFVTATALDGRSRQFRDGFGADFDVPDHRRLYQFQHGERVIFTKGDCRTWGFGLENHADFAMARNPELVQVARATAGFPVAFPPVNERPLVKFRRDPAPELGFPASCVIDGGVLNNAPFGPVLDAITRRKMESPVRRVVVYVVPSGGRAEREDTKDLSCDEIQWYKCGVNALRYPQESNFRSGAEALADLLGGSIRDKALELFARTTEDRELDERIQKVAKELLGEYRRNRAVAVLHHARKRIAASGAVSGLSVMPEPDGSWIDDVLGRGRRADSGLPAPNWVPRLDPREIRGPRKEGWRWGLVAAERVLQCLLGHLHQPLLPGEPEEHDPKKRRALIQGAQQVNGYLHQVLAMLDAVEAELGMHAGGDDIADEGAARLYQRVFDDMNIPEEVNALIEKASKAHVRAMRQVDGRRKWNADRVVASCLAVEVVTRVYEPPSKIVEPLAPDFQFLRLGPDKISPLFDEDRFHDLGDRKLYGIRLQHFGAFVNADWRRSDFAWGRLDAAHHLLHLLPGMSDQERRREEAALHAAILEAEAPGPSPQERPSEESARGWMEGNLKELKKSDSKLLKDFYAGNSAAKETLKGVTGAVLELLEKSGRPADRDPMPSWMKVWDRLVDIGRCVLSPSLTTSELAGRQNRTLRRIRRMTRSLREGVTAAYRVDPLTVRRAAVEGAKRDAWTLVSTILLIGLVAGLVIGAGLGVGLYAAAN